MTYFCKTKLSALIIVHWSIGGCSPSDSFTTAPPAPKRTSAPAKSAAESTAGTPSTSVPATQPTASPQGSLTPEQLQQECWFAVSGTYVGLGDYSDTFPKTFSGRKIGPGEVFDTVGGVFLHARAEPYVYDQGEKEINKAVDYTFDGIVVPPGMSVELRPSANEPVIFKGDGPLIAIAGSESGEGYGSPYTYKAQFDSGALTRWPQWMQDYLKNTGGMVKIIPTHPARWVKVSVVERGRCASAP